MSHSPLASADSRLSSQLLSILLVAGGPVQFTALARATEQMRAAVVASAQGLQHSMPPGLAIQIHGDEVQLVSDPENSAVVQRYLGTEKPPALSRSALETLTVVAYRQPATRAEIEALRGVNSDRALQTLVARGLIDEAGRRAALGRPIEYCTTMGFLEYFGLESLDDLPALPRMEAQTGGAEALGLRSPELVSRD